MDGLELRRSKAGHSRMVGAEFRFSPFKKRKNRFIKRAKIASGTQKGE